MPAVGTIADDDVELNVQGCRAVRTIHSKQRVVFQAARQRGLVGFVWVDEPCPPHDQPCPPHDEPCLPNTLSAVSHRKAMLRGVALISRTEPLHKDPDALLLRGLPSLWVVASVCGGFNDSPVRRRHCQECRR